MLAIALSLLLQRADAIVRRSDVPDSQYVIDHSTHPEIVAVNPGGSLRSRRNATGSFNVECGGTMISKSHIITAAHCFEDGASKSGFAVNVNGKKLAAKTIHLTQIVFSISSRTVPIDVTQLLSNSMVRLMSLPCLFIDGATRQESTWTFMVGVSQAQLTR
jgi:hypothetical protein